MNLIRIRNTCKDCPYLQKPAVDLHKVDQYFTCNLSYAHTYDLEHFKDICPMQTISEVLSKFVCYNAAAKGNEEINYKKELRIIRSFIEEEL